MAIDGQYDEDYEGVPLVFIDGSTVGGSTGLDIRASGTLVRGIGLIHLSWGATLTDVTGVEMWENYVGTDGVMDLGNSLGGIQITGGGENSIHHNLVSGNGGDGIWISNSSSNTLQANLIGTDAAGGTAIPNDGVGILVASLSSYNEVGGANPGEGNVVSGNGGGGIKVDEASATETTGTLIAGNIIGLTSDGMAPLGNTMTGVSVRAPNTTIVGNVVSDNIGRGGIELTGQASGSIVQGNKVGTNIEGTVAHPNNVLGIAVLGNELDNILIGGTSPGEGNLSSGAFAGVYVADGAHGVTIQGNRLGTNAEGTASLDAQGHGAMVTLGAYDVTIGGTVEAARNLISGNEGFGISLEWGAHDITVIGNWIGTNANATGAVPNTTGVYVTAKEGYVIEGNRIGTGEPNAGNLISGNSREGVFVGGIVSSLLIAGNLIGTNEPGTAPLPNESGIVLNATGPVTIGGATLPFANVVSGNTSYGINLSQSESASVIGNKIGTDILGVTSVPNGTHGVYITAGGHHVIGASDGGGNIISGNVQDGVSIQSSPENAVVGNTIGLDAAGSTALPNQGNGVTVEGSDSVNNELRNNVISGNTHQGIRIAGASTRGTKIRGNYIGVDAGGATALGNGEYGVSINGSSNHEIGGTDAAMGNVISGNSRGIMLLTGTTGVLVQNNSIGTDESGTVAIPNTGPGIGLFSNGDPVSGITIKDNRVSGNGSNGISISGNVSQNTIESNTIATNGSGGVVLLGDGVTGNTLTANSIFDNGFVGIDLGNDGVTLNDSGDADLGPNNLQNFPIVEYVISDAGADATQVNVSLDSTPGVPFVVELFHSSSCDPSGHGEGENRFETTISLTTDAGGQAAGTTTFPGAVPVGSYVTATATDANGNTSELSACRVTVAAPTKLGFVAEPTSTTVNEIISPPVRVALQNAAGETVPEGTYAVTLAAAGGAGILQGTTSVSSVGGIATFTDLSIDVVGGGYTLVATAEGLASATSSSFEILVSSTPLSLSVTTTADGGPGSLRQALVTANANAGTQDLIGFEIPGAGPHTIDLSTALPVVTDPVLLDATTQDGYAGTPVVRLDGSH